MKLVILTILVALVVSQSEALRCHCGGSRRCSNPVEVCSGSDSVCGSIIFNAGSRPSYAKGCYKARDCQIMHQPPTVIASCCRSDLCNR